MKNKKITIEDLAGMIQKGFEAVDARFDRTERINTQEHEAMRLRLDQVAY